jgi:3',5'-cyclic AMP phosphodiesterase CpdA
MHTKRWHMLGLLFMISLLTGCGMAGSNRKVSSEPELTMFVATDIHYLAKELNDQGEAFQAYISSGDGKLLSYTPDIVDAFASDIKSKQPDVLIISGDLTNNGEKESHRELAHKLSEIESSSDTQVYVIPGNHDIQNPWARGFMGSEQYVTDSVSAEEFATLYGGFGYEEAISRDTATLSYLAAPSNELYLLMLDTNIYEFNELLGSPMTNGQLKPETLEWIRECSKLAKEKNTKLLTVMHHNLFHHSRLLNSGFTIDNNEEVLEVFRECDIRVVISGHIHIQDIKAGDDREPIYDIVTSALSVNPVQYGNISFTPSEGFQYTTDRVDVEAWAKEQNITDENLLQFKEYAKNYFDRTSYQKVYAALSKAGSYSEEEILLMAETKSILNRTYFAGTTADIREEIMKSRGYQLWKEADASIFQKNYVISMAEDSSLNYNKVFIPVTD